MFEGTEDYLEALTKASIHGKPFAIAGFAEGAFSRDQEYTIFKNLEYFRDYIMVYDDETVTNKIIKLKGISIGPVEPLDRVKHHKIKNVIIAGAVNFMEVFDEFFVSKDMLLDNIHVCMDKPFMVSAKATTKLLEYTQNKIQEGVPPEALQERLERFGFRREFCEYMVSQSILMFACNRVRPLSSYPIRPTHQDVPISFVVPHGIYSPWLTDQNFLSAHNYIAGNTKCCIYHCFEIWQMVRQVKLIPGDILEVGVWRGGTGCIMLESLQFWDMKAHVFLADTFEGIVKSSDKDVLENGVLSDTSEEHVIKLISDRGHKSFTTLKGIFPEETSKDIENRSFRLCHIDVDVYESAKGVFEWVWPRLNVGGVVIFCDYSELSTPGVTRFANEQMHRDDSVFIHNLNGQALMIKTG